MREKFTVSEAFEILGIISFGYGVIAALCKWIGDPFGFGEMHSYLFLFISIMGGFFTITLIDENRTNPRCEKQNAITPPPTLEESSES